MGANSGVGAGVGSQVGSRVGLHVGRGVGAEVSATVRDRVQHKIAKERSMPRVVIIERWRRKWLNTGQDKFRKLKSPGTRSC